MPQSTLRSSIKRIARHLGFDIVRFRPEWSEDAKLAQVFTYLGTDLVFDVGANEGQYVGHIRARGYQGRVVSFEPLSTSYAKLQAAASGDPNWTVHPRCAIGAEDSEITINIASNAASSSVLPMLEQHLKAAPHSHYIGSEKVVLKRLDSVADAYVAQALSIYLKIDTQGFESAVLEGAPQLLSKCRGVQLEMSFVPLYGGQKLWTYFLETMQAKGFELWTLLPGFVDPATGRTLQTDAIFIRH